jgi:hypothetical protein
MKYQDHSPATSLCTSKASFIDCPVDCEPGAMLEPASTSVALAMPTWDDRDYPAAVRSGGKCAKRQRAQHHGRECDFAISHDSHSLICFG